MKKHDASALSIELRRLHERLVEGDRTASAQLASLLLDAMRPRLRHVPYNASDWDLVDSQIGLCIARYLADPSHYDPAKGSLLQYLLWRAGMGAKTDLKKRTKHASLDLVALGMDAKNYTAEDHLIDRLDREGDIRTLEEFQKGLGAQDRAFLNLWGQGVRETAGYAEVLGIVHLPVEQQRAHVKRTRERLRLAIRRFFVARGADVLNG